MKNIFKTALLAAALMFGFSSCGDDNDILDHGAPTNPELEAAGVYTGEWVRTSTNSRTHKVTVTEGAGTLTLVAGDPYVVSVTPTGDAALQIKNVTAGANISKTTGGDYSFYNAVTSNPLGSAFNGKISTDNSVTFTYTSVSSVGLNENVNVYVFTGRKN